MSPILLHLACALAIAGVSQFGAFRQVEAEAAFAEGVRTADSPTSTSSFRQAAEIYEVLRRRGCRNVDLLRNQGRAYLLADELPQAILAFHRGWKLRSEDHGLRNDIAYARGLVNYAADGFGQPPPERWPLWLPQPSLPTLFFTAFLVYTIACLALTRWYVTGWRAYLVTGLTALPAALALACLLLVSASQRAQSDRFPLVVVAKDNVMLRKGNGLSYPPRHDMPLNRGVEARLRYTRGIWIQIELSGGEIGWIPRADALIDQ
jgi:hypothetical protein